jgi:TRAP-type uncharacterized transport system fused permease subunit
VSAPAYVNVALLLGPLLANLGVSFFTAHMFVFYFAVASAITPPVAAAAFAAASITGGEPMRTGVAAVRVGIVMFTIPFVFAWYPEILLIKEAVTITNDMGQQVLIDGSGPDRLGPAGPFAGAACAGTVSGRFSAGGL